MNQEDSDMNVSTDNSKKFAFPRLVIFPINKGETNEFVCTSNSAARPFMIFTSFSSE